MSDITVSDEVLVEHAKKRIRSRYPLAFVRDALRGVTKREKCFVFRIHPFTGRNIIGQATDTPEEAWFQAFALLQKRGQLD